jgi:hypothetical protein
MATVVKVVATGRGIASNRIKGTGTEPKNIGWGTGTTAPLDADTALETASAETKVVGTSSVQTTTTTNDTYRVVGTLTSASVQTISESGLFDDANVLFMRGTFTGIPLDVGDSIQLTIEGQALAPAP